jgi:hypothetical protein
MCATETDSKHTLREIKLMRHLGCHANIVCLQDLYTKRANDEIFIGMDLMDTDLHRIIQSPQKLSDAHFQHVR